MTYRHRRSRRSWLRPETVTPWMSLAVVGLIWWAGVKTITWVSADAAPTARVVRPVDAPLPELAVKSEPTVKAVPAATTMSAPPPTVSSSDVMELRSRELVIPVRGLARDALTSTFHQGRNGREHEAIDILAPRWTEVLAVEDGRIAKLFTSDRGGLTVYQFDSSGEFCYYYAHLDAYAPGLKEAAAIHRGDVIGFVGTTGNAPPGTPHLHFAILKLGPDQRWWEGTPLDPFDVWH